MDTRTSAVLHVADLDFRMQRDCPIGCLEQHAVAATAIDGVRDLERLAHVHGFGNGVPRPVGRRRCTPHRAIECVAHPARKPCRCLHHPIEEAAASLEADLPWLPLQFSPGCSKKPRRRGRPHTGPRVRHSIHRGPADPEVFLR